MGQAARVTATVCLSGILGAGCNEGALDFTNDPPPRENLVMKVYTRTEFNEFLTSQIEHAEKRGDKQAVSKIHHLLALSDPHSAATVVDMYGESGAISAGSTYTFNCTVNSTRKGCISVATNIQAGYTVRRISHSTDAELGPEVWDDVPGVCASADPMASGFACGTSTHVACNQYPGRNYSASSIHTSYTNADGSGSTNGGALSSDTETCERDACPEGYEEVGENDCEGAVGEGRPPSGGDGDGDGDGDRECQDGQWWTFARLKYSNISGWYVEYYWYACLYN